MLLLIYALDSFGVSGNVVKISPGPVVTLYEIEPAEGVRVNKFTTLSEDLSRIMGGKRVRIIAPIPGSKSVGIELPNESPSIVYLKSIINSKNGIGMVKAIKHLVSRRLVNVYKYNGLQLTVNSVSELREARNKIGKYVTFS